MDTININLLDSSEKIPFILTYGIQKELQTYLMADDRLFQLLADASIAEQVVIICLSKRNEVGQITHEFSDVQNVSAEDITILIDYIFEYFSDFFLKNQEKMTKLTTRLSQVSQQSETSQKNLLMIYFIGYIVLMV